MVAYTKTLAQYLHHVSKIICAMKRNPVNIIVAKES